MGSTRRTWRRSRRIGVGAVAGAVLLAAVAAAPALAAVPTVTTNGVGSLSYQSVVLFGNVNPHSESTVIYFQYGTTKRYGFQSAPAQLSGGAKAIPISIAVSGLTAATTYHYRIVATNRSGTALGADRTFTTARIPLSLAIAAVPNPILTGSPVTIEGTLTGTGSANARVQLQQNQYPYTGGFVDVGNPELTLANGSFAFNVLGVGLNTQYRVVSGATVSPVVTVSAMLGVTLSARSGGTHANPTVRFSGTIAPAEPSSRIALERLVGRSWRVVGGTVAHANAVNGVVSFAKTLHLHKGGFFRALALPVEGGHVSGYSGPVLVKVR